jgi:Spy/CpxP family protein refolding chaperone
MQRKMDFWMMWLGLLVVAAILTPCLGQAQEKGAGGYRMEREKLVKEMNLPPDTAKAFQAVGDKYAQTRKALIERIRKNDGELEKALVASPPDEGKIKGLVALLTADHDELFQTFRVQRQEELALLTPVQQGKFLIALKKWHAEIREKYEKPRKQ